MISQDQAYPAAGLKTIFNTVLPADALEESGRILWGPDWRQVGLTPREAAMQYRVGAALAER